MPRRSVRAAFLAGVLVASISACADGGDAERSSEDAASTGEASTTPSSTEASSTTTEPERLPEVFVVAECDDRTSDPLTLYAIDANSGEVVAQIGTGLAELRMNPRQPFSSGACANGNGFSSDLSRVGGYTTTGGTQRAGWFSISTIIVASPWEPSAEASTQIGGYFIGDDFWFYEATELDRTIYRMPSDGGVEEVGTCAWENSIGGSMPPQWSAAAAPYCIDGHTDRSLVSDDGQRALVGSQLITAGNPLPGEQVEVTGGDAAEQECSAYRWVSETEYVCRDGVILGKLDGSSATLTELVVPPDGVTYRTPVPGPNGQRVAFLACERTCRIFSVDKNVPYQATQEVQEVPEMVNATLVGWFGQMPGWMA